jgi:hypothetical protein
LLGGRTTGSSASDVPRLTQSYFEASHDDLWRLPDLEHRLRPEVDTRDDDVAQRAGRPRPQPSVPKLTQADKGTLKGQLIKLGMYPMAARFKARPSVPPNRGSGSPPTE